MNFVELFAGIGGFSLGFERAGMKCIGHVEINPYAQKVLIKHWPKVKLLPDVTKVKGDEFGQVDLLCGGFPCQDLSVAGKQAGITGERSGLYDEIIRIAGVCRPKFIVLENVANLIARPEWIGYVLGRLSEIGYDTEWEIIRASDVGAPHKRARVWIVAYPNSHSEPNGTINEISSQRKLGNSKREYASRNNSRKSTGIRLEMGRDILEKKERSESKYKSYSSSDVANTTKSQLHKTGKRHNRKRGTTIGFSDGSGKMAHTDQERLQRVRSNQNPQRWKGQDKRPTGLRSRAEVWDTEPNVGRVANGVSSRVDRLKCLGNALVPQIAEYIGQQILLAED